MKSVFTLLIVCMLSVTMFAQRDVTKFLGIPVDGTKSEMIQKLKAKGFKYDAANGHLTGQFNGANVNVYVVENNEKVWRIMVCDATYMDEGSIRIRFNRLCEQFMNNAKYSATEDYKLPEDEKIAYEITVNSKKYDAVFYQNPEQIDSIGMANKVKDMLLNKYSEEQLNNPTEEIQNEAYSMIMKMAYDLLAMKPVWFRITDFYGDYYITMFYDNEYNRANGEDL